MGAACQREERREGRGPRLQLGLRTSKREREKGEERSAWADCWAEWREKDFSFLLCFPISFSKPNSNITKVKFKWSFKHTFQFKQNEQFW